MRNFYTRLQQIIEMQQPYEKIAAFGRFYKEYKDQELLFDNESEVKYFQQPSYVPHCKVVAPQDVPKRRNLTTKEGAAIFLHAIMHIEYSAIDLALDAAYRFRDLPKSFYDDWLEVADDEIRHFLSLDVLLKELGYSYGDIEVHNALFEASQKTQTLLERMAVVPRYLEANGLDATPMMIEKIQRLPHNEMLRKIVKALEVIVYEEIDHVKKGDRWFEYAVDQEGVSKDIYFDIIQKYYPRGFEKPRALSVEARKEAGFSCDELAFMAKKDVC